MEAPLSLHPQNSTLAEGQPPTVEASQNDVEPLDQIEVMDAIHQGYQASRVILEGIDSGLAFTRELIDARDGEWTYYLHYDGLEKGKCFGEVDVRLSEDTFSVYGQGVREDLKADSRHKAESLFIGSMALLPLVIKKDFPGATTFEDYK